MRLPTTPASAVGALRILDAEGRPLIVAEVELGKVALQVLLREMVVGAHDPALEDREVALNGVRVNVAAHVLADAVIDRTAALELAAKRFATAPSSVMTAVAASICSLMMGLRFFAVTDGTWCERTLPPRSTSENTASLPTPPVPRCLRLLGVLVLLLAADIGLVNLDNLALAAERAGAFGGKLPHPLADAMRHEPSRSVGAEAEHPVKLMRAHPLLGGGMRCVAKSHL